MDISGSQKFKPLNKKVYGSIPHFPGSRMGPGDHHCHKGQAAICTIKSRDKNDRIIVTEKVDGSCCAVLRLSGSLFALGRAGYLAQSSQYEQHQLFAYWVRNNENLFDFVKDGTRVVGEWLAQAHGTRYQLRHQPFCVFDLIDERGRQPWDYVVDICYNRLPVVSTISDGHPFPIESAMEVLKVSNHGALDPVEGAVWRVERKGKFDFMAKYVRPDKIDGCYLPEMTGGEPIWNWRP